MFSFNSDRQKLFIAFLMTAFICAWLPLFDPTVAKFLPLPFLVFFLRFENRVERWGAVLLLFIVLLIFLVHPYSRKYLLYELTFLLLFLFGHAHPSLKMTKTILISTFLAFIFYLLARFSLLPWEWQQPISFFSQEFMGKTVNLPSFFSNPSPMCLFFVLGAIPFFQARPGLKFLYILFSFSLVIQSAATLGTVLYFAVVCLLLFERHFSSGFDKKDFGVFSRRIWLLPLLFAFLIPIVAMIMPDSNMLRSLQTRRILYAACLQNLFSASPVGFISGYGPAHFHENSGTFMPPETRKLHISRNQFHPHNDLLYYWYSYGLSGLLLRLVFYLMILRMVFLQYRFLPLLFFLLQIQFSPDALSLPAGALFFFFVGQFAASSSFFFVGQSAVSSASSSFGQSIASLSSFFISRPVTVLSSFFAAQSVDRFFVVLRLVLFLLLSMLCCLLVYSQFFYSQAVNGEVLPQFQPFFRSPALDYNYAVRKFRDGQLTKSIYLVQNIKKRAPHFQDIDYLLGLSLAKQNREQEAVPVLREKIRIDPYLLESWLLLSDILINIDNLSAACSLLNEGGSLFPQEPLFAKKLNSFCSH